MTLSHPVSHVIIHAHTVNWFLLGIWTVNFKRKIYFRYFVKRDNKTEYLLLSRTCHSKYSNYLSKIVLNLEDKLTCMFR